MNDRQADDRTAIRTLLLADLVGSTDLTIRLGDARAAALFAAIDRCAREGLTQFHGREIDRSDGYLLMFERPIDAVHYALRFHRELRRLGEQQQLTLEARVGIHLGEVILHENAPEAVAAGAKPLEVEGLAKPLTARFMSLAMGGQTLMTRSAFDLARRAAIGNDATPPETRWLAHGTYAFKGVDEPMEVFEVGQAGSAPLKAPPDAEKARRALSPGEEPMLGWRPAPDLELPVRRNWRLSEKLGEGGFGEVWLARNALTGDRRVFKFCFDPVRLRSLKREVTVFRLIRQSLGDRPDIAPLLDWNFEEPPFFLESAWTQGGSLLDWSERKGGLQQIPLQVRLELTAQTADALQAAHSIGLLHKDIKPRNILIYEDPEGRPRIQLADFGISVLQDRKALAEKGITAAGMTATPGSSSDKFGGTMMYQAPELFEGRDPTPRSDIYAMGVLLYQMAVGDLNRALAPGWERDVDDPVLLEDIRVCVDGNPARRLESAKALADRLRKTEERREALRLLAEEKESKNIRQQAEQRRRRRRRYLWIAAGIAAVYLIYRGRLERAEWEASQARREAEQVKRGDAWVGFLQNRWGLGELDITALSAEEQAKIGVETPLRILCAGPSPGEDGEKMFIAGDGAALGNWKPNSVAMTPLHEIPDGFLWEYRMQYAGPFQFKFTFGRKGEDWANTEEWPGPQDNREFPSPRAHAYATDNGKVLIVCIFGMR